LFEANLTLQALRIESKDEAVTEQKQEALGLQPLLQINYYATCRKNYTNTTVAGSRLRE
jgi:hypothetical protein